MGPSDCPAMTVIGVNESAGGVLLHCPQQALFTYVAKGLAPAAIRAALAPRSGIAPAVEDR